ncbi:MAG: hypothetical protein MI923_24540 [Phycisphaerales bacterium]|nr:hypothetical protein [Phycisphaerales bacterium]
MPSLSFVGDASPRFHIQILFIAARPDDHPDCMHTDGLEWPLRRPPLPGRLPFQRLTPRIIADSGGAVRIRPQPRSGVSP